MRPATPYSYPGIGLDLRRLARLLGLGLDAIAWRPPASPAVLNLACGRADETGTLVNALAPAATRLFYLGIDLRPPEINEARARWRPAAPAGWELDFRVADASKTDQMNELPALDFIFIRHQNFWTDPPVWTALFQNALAKLKPAGTLALTSYFDHEHDLASACLRQIGARRLASIHHPESRALHHAPGKSVDRHLGLFRVHSRPSGFPLCA